MLRAYDKNILIRNIWGIDATIFGIRGSNSKNSNYSNLKENTVGNYEFLIPITLFVVSGGIAIVALIMQYQKRQLESQEIIAAIEKGVDVKFPDKKRNRLLPGLVWTLMGLVMTLGMAIAMPDDGPSGMWVWGLIPVAVGVSYLIVHRLEGQAEENSPKD